MKKIAPLKLLIVLCILISTFANTFAKVYDIDNDTSYTAFDINDTIVDNGGLLGNYAPNQNSIITVSSNNSYLLLHFKELNLADGDTLFVYNGSDTTGTQAQGSPFVTGSTPAILYAYDNNQPFTLKFKTDGVNEAKGFIIETYSAYQLPCANLLLPKSNEKDVAIKPMFAWNTVIHATEYIINITDNNNFNFTDTITDTTYTYVAELILSKNYNWSIKAKSNNLMNSECNSENFTTLCLPAVSKPVIGGPEIISSETDFVTLTATPPGNNETASWYYNDGQYLFENDTASTTKFYGIPGSEYQVIRENSNQSCSAFDTIIVSFAPNLNTDLQQWYKMDSPDSAKNEPDSYYNLTFYGATNSAQDRNFKNGGAITMASGAGYATNNAFYHSGTEFSASIWTKIWAPTGGSQCLIDMGGKAILTYETDDKFHLRTNYSTNNCTTYITDLATPSTYSANIWVHVAFTVNNNIQKLFINGILVVSDTLDFSEIGYNNCWNTFNIGKKENDESTYIKALVDEVRYYTRALTDNEVALLPNPPVCTTPKPIVADTVTIYEPNNNVTLHAKGGTEYRWYTQPNGFMLGVGATYNVNFTVNVEPKSLMEQQAPNNNLQIMYVSNYSNGCESDKVPVAIIKHDTYMGLYGFYPLNGSVYSVKGYADSSYTANATYGPDRFGNPNAAFNFNNTNFIRLDSTQIGNELSVAMYINTLMLPDTASLFSRKGVIDLQLLPEGEINVLNNIDNGCDTLTQVLKSSKLSANRWYHIAYTSNNQGIEKLYIDGNLVDSIKHFADTIFRTCNPNIYRYLGHNEQNKNYTGQMDEVYIYDRAISKNEINNLLSLCTTPAPDADTVVRIGSGTVVLNANGNNIKWYNSIFDSIPIAQGNTFVTPYLHKSQTFYVSQTTGCQSQKAVMWVDVQEFDKAELLYIPFTNGSFADSSYNEYILTDTLTIPGIDRFGKANQARYFNDNLTTSLAANNLYIYNLNTFTYSAWFKLNNKPVVENVILEDQYNVSIQIDSVGKLKAIVYLEDGIIELLSTDTVNLTQYQHFALTYENYKAILYLNGKPVAEAINSYSYNLSGYYQYTTNLAIGKSYKNPSIGYAGLIDDIRLYNQAISPQMVNNLYNLGTNQKPNVLPITFNIFENKPANTKVGTIPAFDNDANQQLEFQIINGNTGNTFKIDAYNGTVFVNDATLLNFESNELFILAVKVSDNGNPMLDSTVNINININNVNEQPILNATTLAIGACKKVNDTIYTLQVTDPDVADKTFTFNILDGDTNTFNIDILGNIILNNALVTDTTYMLLVKATDMGELSDTAYITINVSAKPQAMVTANDANPVCNGTTVELTASGADTYNWESSVDLMVWNNISSNSSITVKPTDTTYYKVVGSQLGCSDTFIYTLTIAPIYTDTITDTICKGNSYTLPDNITVTNAGLYTSTLKTAIGCDSIIVTNLIVIDLQPVNLTADNDTITVGSKVTYTATQGFNSYKFMVNGIEAQNTALNTFETSNLNNSDTVMVKAFNSFGCSVLSNTIVITVTAVDTGCNIVAQFDTTVNNAQMQVQLVNITSGNATAYYWDFGNGSTSNQTNATVTYTLPGQYIIKLLASDSTNKCISTIEKVVKVGTVACQANFSFNIDTANLLVSLTNQSGGDYNKLTWTFDDNTYSTLNNVEKTFANGGIHTITLTIANNNLSCFASKQQQIQLPTTYCSANFEYFVSADDKKVHLKNTSLGSYTGAVWNFGDGSVSTETNPVKQFNYNGYQNIKLTINNENNSCINSISKNILINNEGIDCEADFEYVVNNATQTVSFYNTSKGNTNKWIWNFNYNNSIATTKNASYTYTKGGVYNVCLLVVSTSGISNISCKKVEVAATEANNCQARFESFVDNTKATLIDASTGEPNNWFWNLGDNYTYTTQNGVHNYNESGFYVVSLKIKNAAGCSNITANLLRVNNNTVGLRAAFIENILPKTEKATGYPVDFVGVGMGDNSRLKWNFGDGSVDSTTNTPVHEFAEPGTYNVCYTVSDPITGDENTSCKTITVGSGNAVSTINFNNNVKLYPVPFNNVLNVAISSPELLKSQLQIFDINGRLLVNQQLLGNSTENIYTINTSNLSSGVYTLKLISGNNTNTKMLIKK